jgi:Arc/MetJ-type ribon-helix-helix transcriptional regulator
MNPAVYFILASAFGNVKQIIYFCSIKLKMKKYEYNILNVNLPTELYAKLDAFVANVIIGNNNDFIVEAIEQKLQSEKDQLHLKLAEGYQATKLEDLTLVKEFEFADYEKVKS